MRHRLVTAALSFALTSAASAQVVHLPYLPINGPAASAVLGFSVSGAGDVDNDGFDDIVVGAPGELNSNGVQVGSARVISGRTGVVLYTFFGDAAADQFGYSVSGAGDVNNDGFDDIIVGARLADANGADSGRARVYSGRTGAVLYTVNGGAARELFGSSVSGAGDVDKDGFADFIVGAPNANSLTGYAILYSGATGAVIYFFQGPSGGAQFGTSVSGAGDVNGDGFDDVIVGAPLASGLVGSAYVLCGATGQIRQTFTGDAVGDQFGWSVSGAGDVNGDGFDDLIVGAHRNGGNGIDAGRVRVYSGATGAILHTFSGDSAGDQLGWSVSGAGDVNGDGVDDLIAGAFGDDNNGSDSGSARVFSGATGAILYTFNGDSSRDQFGWSVSGAGDVNGDGLADLIVGARLDSNNGLFSGTARVFFSFTLPTGTPCPGDLNGDGAVNFADLNGVLSNFGVPCPQ